MRAGVLLDDEQLAVASEHNVYLALQHVNVYSDVDIHKLGLYREERNSTRNNCGVEGAVVWLGHRVLVVEAVVTVDHHSPVAVVTISRVTDEILLAFRTLLIHVAEIAGVSHGVVVAFAFSSSYWITSVSVTITVTFNTRCSQ